MDENGDRPRVRIIPIQVAKDHPSAATTTNKSVTLPADPYFGSRRSPKKQVRSLIVPKMRRMFEKSRSAEPEVTRPTTTTRNIKINIQSDCSSGSNRARGDGTESVCSFVVVDKPNSLGLKRDESPNLSEWSLSDEPDHKGFVNRCVSKVKSLVRQGSP